MTQEEAQKITALFFENLEETIKSKYHSYIDNNGSPELTVTKNTENTGAKIYTKNPRFTSTSNYPVIYEMAIVENEMYKQKTIDLRN
jgi:hypothetical protein